MQTVFKYPLKIQDEQQVKLPRGARLLRVMVQNGVPCLWAQVESGRDTEDRTIFIHGTAHPVDPNGEYLDSFMVNDGALVFHVFFI